MHKRKITRITPTREALEHAYLLLKKRDMTLNDMLKVPALKIALEETARLYMMRQARFDAKAARLGNDA